MRFEHVSDFKLSWKISIILNLIAGVVFFLGFALFIFIYIGCSEDMYCIRLLENSNIWVTYAVIIAQVILHEYSHGIGYKLSGGKAAYGIKWLCPYCREVSGIYYSTGNFIITLILPLLTGTAAGLLAVAIFPQFLYYSMICMLMNFSGASGDIAMLIYVLFKTGKGEFVRDEPYGFSIHRLINTEPA